MVAEPCVCVCLFLVLQDITLIYGLSGQSEGGRQQKSSAVHGNDPASQFHPPFSPVLPPTPPFKIYLLGTMCHVKSLTKKKRRRRAIFESIVEESKTHPGSKWTGQSEIDVPMSEPCQIVQ